MRNLPGSPSFLGSFFRITTEQFSFTGVLANSNNFSLLLRRFLNVEANLGMLRGWCLRLEHPEVGLFRYLVALDPLLPQALFPPPWEKKRKEEELELELVESELETYALNYYLDNLTEVDVFKKQSLNDIDKFSNIE
ncbi:hypothetical protein Tco_1121754 [Tanacetum coccineum]|uniref:Uncharacterized protein n=1 Tax=Tanacetum coccineum TaxID=301880 RepID=A0ABQ5J2B8_9ASTR